MFALYHPRADLPQTGGRTCPISVLCKIFIIHIKTFSNISESVNHADLSHKNAIENAIENWFKMAQFCLNCRQFRTSELRILFPRLYDHDIFLNPKIIFLKL